MLPELIELETFRLERDWTYEQLIHDMRLKRIRLSLSTIYFLLKRNGKPTDRTLHKLRLYLQRTKTERKRAHRSNGLDQAVVVG